MRAALFYFVFSIIVFVPMKAPETHFETKGGKMVIRNPHEERAAI